VKVCFLGKLTRASRKRNIYVVYVPKSVAELLQPGKKYLVIITEPEEVKHAEGD